MQLPLSSQKPFLFRAPSRVEVVGSFAIHAAVRPDCALDLAVEIPQDCFDDKDQLNHRYHAKRALYLSHVATALEKKASALGIAAVEWGGCVAGDPRRPFLLVRLQDGGPPLRILAAAPPTAFPLHRLHPSRNNLRTATKPGGKGGEPELLPTPFYNAGIVQDMLMIEHAAVMRAAGAAAGGYAHAAMLLRVWAARQRLCEGADGLSGFFLTMLLAHLVQSGRAVSSCFFFERCYSVFWGGQCAD